MPSTGAVNWVKSLHAVGLVQGLHRFRQLLAGIHQLLIVVAAPFLDEGLAFLRRFGALLGQLLAVAGGVLQSVLGVDQAGLGAQDVQRGGGLLARQPVIHLRHPLGHAELTLDAGQRVLVHLDLGLDLRQPRVALAERGIIIVEFLGENLRLSEALSAVFRSRRERQAAQLRFQPLALGGE